MIKLESISDTDFLFQKGYDFPKMDPKKYAHLGQAVHICLVPIFLEISNTTLIMLKCGLCRGVSSGLNTLQINYFDAE